MQTRRLERTAGGPSFGEFVAGEFEKSPVYGGRSVFGWEKDMRAKARPKPAQAQLGF